MQHRACLSAARAEADDEWPLLRDVRRAVHDYALIQPGDRIAVAVSGGKDSSTLAFLLKRLKERRLLPFDDWSFTTVHLDQVQPGHDAQSLEAWLEGEGIDFHLLREDTYSVVTEKTRPGASYCSLCSRLRRGILYTAAAELKSNRLALGHHRDDALETLLLNMVHQGQLKALPARYRARRGIDVIRPLMYIGEKQIAEFASSRGFPILPCNLCGSQPDGTPGQRQQMKLLLSALDGLGDGKARANMLTALADVRPTHLLDRDLREACGLDRASGALRYERGRAVAHGEPNEAAAEEATAEEEAAAEKQAAAAEAAEAAEAEAAGEAEAAEAAAAEAEAAAAAAEAAEAAAAASPLQGQQGQGQGQGTQRAPVAGSADARRSRFRATTSVPIYCAPSVSAYEAGVAQLVRSGDSVLEVGCQLGRTTALLANITTASGFVLGVDMHRELNGKSGKASSYRCHATPAAAGLDPSCVHLALVDPWDTLALLSAVNARAIDVLAIDVNSLLGNDLMLTALSLARQLSRVLPGLRCVLLKSRSVAKVERQLVLPEAFAAEEGPVPRAWLPRVIPAVGVKEYRAAARSWLDRHPGRQRVLEIGCHVGTSTALLAEAVQGRGGFVAGVDVSRSIVERATALHGGRAAFGVADAWDAAGLVRVWGELQATHGGDDEAGGGPTLLCLDVGGVSSAQGELDALSLVELLSRTFSETLQAVVVKSRCLKSSARTLKPVGWAQRRKARGGGGDGRAAEAAAAGAAEDAAAPIEAREVALARHLPGSEAPTRERLRDALKKRHAGVAVVVENGRKGNVASIARTAECLGISSIHLVYTPDQVVSTRGFGGMVEEVRSRWLSKLSKSATDWLEVRQHRSIAACAQALREDGYDALVATVPADGAVPLYSDSDDAAWAHRNVALLFGSEAAGLSDEALSLADVKVTVPQTGMTQSLNVAACAAIVIAEVLRKRAGREGDGDESAGLSEGEQRRLEAKLMPSEAALRMHNKATAKAALRRRQPAMHAARAGRVQCCSSGGAEEERAQRFAARQIASQCMSGSNFPNRLLVWHRRQDDASRRAEMEGTPSSISDEDMRTLREYIGVVTEKEEKLAEMREMLRVWQASIGVQLVSPDDKILPAAWAFVALNALLAVYLAKSLLLDPFARMLTGGSGNSNGWPMV